ncbi:MAG TPA: VOC family protein [Acidimicrobiia bacterium]|nr:VOC family protein [Acidimicrobiia bacterium]
MLGDAPDYVILIVEDLDRAVGFYTETLGLTLGHRAGSYAQLATGLTRVGLYERAAMSELLGRPLGAPDPDRPGFELGFLVADCDATYADLVARGAAGAVEPTDRPWGQRTAYVRDPDGHLVELAQPLTPPPTSPATGSA